MHTSSSQTIGPYLHIGMTWLVDETMAGATVAFVLPAALLGPMPQDMSLPFGGAGALCAGVCSLLAQDYRSQKARPGDTSGSPS